MPFTPENSAIRLTPEIEEALKDASPDQMKEIFREALVSQHLAVRDIYSPDVLIPTALASAPRPTKFARAVTIDGKKHIVEADSEPELEKAEVALYRSVLQPTTAAPAATTTSAPARDAATGRFKSPAEQGADDERKAALNSNFNSGRFLRRTMSSSLEC